MTEFVLPVYQSTAAQVLEAGSYRIHVEADGYESVDRDTTVRTGELTTETFTMKSTLPEAAKKYGVIVLLGLLALIALWAATRRSE